MEIYRVILSVKAKRDLLKMPKYFIKKLSYWIDEVGNEGLSSVRKISGYYEIDQSGVVHCVEIVEVNKHEY